MSRALITEAYLTDIANAIRTKLGVQDMYTPPQMAAAIESIPTGITPTGTVNIAQNGTHDVTQYASANVNVQPNLQSKTVTENGTVTPDQGYDGLSSVVVDVSGGGGSNYIEQWDLTKSRTGTIRGFSFATGGVDISDQGAVFNATSDYLRVGMRLPVTTIEIDVVTMNLASGTHRRFVMTSDTENVESGFIYRSNGRWSFYGGNYWATDSNITDSRFFENSTVKIVIDANGYWHIYKDNTIVYEPNRPYTTKSNILIGAYSSSINNAVISGVRIY